MTLIEQLNVIRKTNVLFILNKVLASMETSINPYLTSERISYLNEEMSKYTIYKSDEEIKSNAEKEIEETINSSKIKRQEIESTINKKTLGLERYKNALQDKKKKIKLLVIFGVELFFFLAIALPLIITMIVFNSIIIYFIGSIIMTLGLMVGAFFISKSIVNKVFNNKLKQKEESYKKECKDLEDELFSLSDKKIEERINRIKEKCEQELKSNNEKELKRQKIINEIEELNKSLSLYVVVNKYYEIENNYFKKCELQVKKTLEKLLSMSPLNEKYYSLECICQIMEYLETGRCDELQGKDGCYNLLESEVSNKRIEVVFNEISNKPELHGQQSSSKKQVNEIKDILTKLKIELNIIKNDYLKDNSILKNFDYMLQDSYPSLTNLHKNQNKVDLCIDFNRASNSSDSAELDKICQKMLIM